MEPLFTKSDLLVRTYISKTLKALTGKFTASLNITLKELSYCIDQRLYQIEKYLNIEKEQNGEINIPSRRARGATMAGILQFGKDSLKEIGERATKDTFEMFSSRDSLFGESHRNTLENKLEMFKVTNSDEEDSNYFDESDNELEIETMLNQSKKKTKKRENIFGNSVSPKRRENDASPQRRGNSVSTLSMFEKKVNRRQILERSQTYRESTGGKIEFDTKRKTSIEDQGLKGENPNKVDRVNKSFFRKDTDKATRKLTKENKLESIDVDMPLELSVKKIMEIEENSNEDEEEEEIQRKPTIIQFESEASDDEEYELRRSSPVLLNFEEDEEKNEIMLESNLRMTQPIYPESNKNNHRIQVFNIFEDFDEIDNLVKELKEKEEQLIQSKKSSQKNNRRKSLKAANLWKKVLTAVARNKNFQNTKPQLEKQGSKEIETDQLEICAQDIERLTASDPAEYFKSNTTLLSKMSIVTIDEFEYVHTLGEGAYGKVFLVRKKATGDYFAMKVIGSDQELSSKYIKNLLNEREVFSVIKSNFCVNALATFTYENLVCFVMEYLPGRDLYEELFERETYWLDSFSVKFYLAEIILGIEDLHDNGVIHRDIKPANVLIDEEGHLRLTDFGLSEFRSKIGSKIGKNGNYIKGSANYIAPEVIRGDEVSFEVDWWALGIMAYLMVEREFPFDGESIQEVFDNIIKGDVDWSNVGKKIFC